MIRPVLAAAVFACIVLPARAWDPIGHMLVSQIAYDRLTPTAKARLDEAIARLNAKEKPDAPYDAVIAACWMDDIRSRTKDYNLWHYVNLPFTPEGMPAPDGSTEPNVIWGIRKCEDILAGKVVDPAIDKDQALVMLEHLVGDIHQPLHTTSRPDDAGGNKTKVGNLKDPLADLIFSKGGNLHFFWDSAYRRVHRNGEATVLYEAPLYDRTKPVDGHKAVMGIIRREATALEKKYPPAMFHDQGDPLTWAKESHALGYHLGYQNLPPSSNGQPVKLTQAYVDAARACAEERIALAGYRLGNLLNQILDSPPTAQPTP
ncbi:MAG: S1/P1 nuclease [Terrimicrobiaceae bacterium]|nr:S1/P1 nuclease [Terrimicrobiaceae bacterium]